MESIILFVLIAVASSVIQAVAQGSKQKKTSPNVQNTKPKLQPVVKTLSNTAPRVSNPSTRSNIQAAIPKRPEASMEGIQTEALENIVTVRQEIEHQEAEASAILPDISYDELQRSIIMAEVLGKPKALQKPIR